MKFIVFTFVLAVLLGGVSAAPAEAGALAISCAVCPRTIVYAGLTRTLTLAREESGNTLQCNYDTPAISGFSPACLYMNVNQALIFTNTGGSCPATAGFSSQTGSSCTASV